MLEVAGLALIDDVYDPVAALVVHALPQRRHVGRAITKPAVRLLHHQRHLLALHPHHLRQFCVAYRPAMAQADSSAAVIRKASSMRHKRTRGALPDDKLLWGMRTVLPVSRQVKSLRMKRTT